MKSIDVIGCAGSSIFLLLAATWIPFIGPFFSLLTPLPFLYYTTKLGLHQGLKTAAITLLVAGLIAKLTGYQEIVFFCLEFSLLGLVISEIYKRRFTFGLTIFWGTSFMLLIGIVFLFLISFSKQMGPPEMILEYFQNNLRETIRAYESMGLDQEKVFQLHEYGKVITNIISMVYPALLIIGTGVVVWLNVVISRPLFRRGNLSYPDFGSMDHWQAPELMVWGVIASGFALFLTTGGIKFLAVNALMVVSVIYIFHGMSIILFFLNKYHVSPWIRFGVYLLIIFQQIFLIGLAVAGLFDQWIDFRKIHKKKEG